LGKYLYVIVPFLIQVLSEYLSQGCTEKSEEKLWAKFDKRLKKVPGVKLAGDKVKFVVPDR